MANNFIFYDLETSGLNSRHDRIMQFAAIRTDLDLNPVDEPYNFLIQLSTDTLPSPNAIRVTGITPQQTLEEGYTEAEAAKKIIEEIFTPNSIVVGFNNIRFDDEFIRHLLWRNFYDSYTWAYQDGRSRWDLLDVVRFYRAMRPDGLKWPVDEAGRAVNKLELLTSINGVEHSDAHDALSDVRATVAVAQLLKQADPKLWQYLLKMRDKNLVRQLVNLERPEPFVYVSGRLEAGFDKTALAYPICCGNHNNIIVYNLRYDPTEFLNLSVADLATHLSAKFEELAKVAEKTDAPVDRPVYFKELKYNQCPAVAPLSTLRDEDYRRLRLDKKQVMTNLEILKNHPELGETIGQLYRLRQSQTEAKYAEVIEPAEAQLYGGFLGVADQRWSDKIRQAGGAELKNLDPKFNDGRLPSLFINYKARSFPETLTDAEQSAWESYRTGRLQAQLETFLTELQTLAASLDSNDQYLAEELKLWLESLAPEE